MTVTNGSNDGSFGTIGELFPTLVHLRVDSIAPANSPGPTTTALALSPRHRYDRILFADAVDVAVTVLANAFIPKWVQVTDKDGVVQMVEGTEDPQMRWPTPSEIAAQGKAFRENCRREVLRRLVWDTQDTDAPHVRPVSWEASIGKYGLAITGRAEIPGLGMVPVKPIAVAGIPYLIKSGALWVSNGTDRCMFMRPHKDGDPWIAISVRLCREVLIRKLMEILDAAGSSEARFAALPNKVRTPAACKILFTSTLMGAAKYRKDFKYIGNLWGKTVLLHKKSQFEGIVIGKEYVFRLHSESESEIVLFFLGEVGGLEIDDPEFKLGIKAGLDPALVLEKDVKLVNPNTIIKETEDQWEATAFEDLPGLAYLIESGLIKSEDGEDVILAIVRDERMRAAKAMMNAILDAIRVILEQKFSRLPSLESLLGGVEFEAMLEAEDGDDPITALIAERLGEFSWEMPSCVIIREKILRQAKKYPAGNMEQEATPNAPAAEHEAPPVAAPNTTAPRPEVVFNDKVREARIKFDAYALLGLEAETAMGILAELRLTPGRDVTVAALVVNPLLEAKGKAPFDPTNVADEMKLIKLIDKVCNRVIDACGAVVTAG